ncbi:tetratricopeptide repeat protein [Reichenbachiella sp.]|uniref:tetratricopeptide repeat protein n=1 Tax=Reichenbachiella sp. TaxID=2184521 RepID=UPI003B59A95B
MRSNYTPVIWLMLISQVSLAQSSMWDKPIISSRALIDSLEVLLPQMSSEERVKNLNLLAEAYWEVNADKTIEYGQQALTLARRLHDQKEEGYALLNICQGFLFNDAYDQALDYGLKSLSVREAVGEAKDIAFTLRTLGWLYYDIGYLDHALNYHYKVLEIHQELKDNERIAYSYNSLGLIYAKKSEHEKAIDYFDKSLKLKKPFSNDVRISESLKNLGISYAAIGHLDLAEANLKKALTLIDNTKDYYDRVETLNELALVYFHRKMYDQSLTYLKEARIYIASLNVNKVLKERNYQISAELYHQLGDHEQALTFFKAYDSIKKEILSDEKQYRLAEMRILYEAERRENEVRLLKQEKEAEGLRKNALFVGIILLLVIGVLIVNRLVSGMKKNKKIFEINQNLVKVQLEKEEVESARLKERLEYRKKELTKMGLFISQRNETYQLLANSLKKFDFLDRADADQKIKSLISEFESRLKINEDIDGFYSDVEQLHDDFFFRLKEKFPNLTDNDMRLAAQLRLNLSSKEISSLNNISVKSVEISRYRLRKKLELDPDDILTDYLRDV